MTMRYKFWNGLNPKLEDVTCKDAEKQEHSFYFYICKTAQSPLQMVSPFHTQQL